MTRRSKRTFSKASRATASALFHLENFRPVLMTGLITRIDLALWYATLRAGEAFNTRAHLVLRYTTK